MISLIPLVVLIPLGSAALALALPGRRRAQQLITVIALVAVVALSGAFMWIVDQQGDPIEGEIVWAEGKLMGCHFAEALSPTICNRIIRTLRERQERR